MSMPSEAFQTHLAGDVTTLCHCWRIVRRDGTQFGFTDHDRALDFEGMVFDPESGLAASEARAELGLAAGGMEVEGALSSARITDADIDAGLYDAAAVDTLLVNWREPAQNILLRRSTVGKITRRDGRFVVELQNRSAVLDRIGGRHLRRTCDATLGDARCGVDLTQPGYTAKATVVSVGGPEGLTVAGVDAFAAGWFTEGTATFTSGLAAGASRPVVAHHRDGAGVRIVVADAAALPIADGDTFTVTAGCDKRFATCRATFANSLNFRGFPHLPGNDAAYAYVNDGQSFDGGALVP